MKAIIGSLIGLISVLSVSAEPLVEGRVRLDSGEPVAEAQVRIFDLSDLQRGAIARAMTDGTGYFALPLAVLGGRALPERFALGPNYPNPFNPSTIIPYQLAASSQVRLEVFNLLGQRIATLVDGARPAGFHTAAWNATDAAGRAVGAGVYIYRMTVGAASQTGRMVLIDGQAGVSSAGAAADFDWLGAEGGSSEGEPVYGLIVSGEGLAPYVDRAFRVEAGMAPVELVVSSGSGKAADDDCALCDLFDALDDDDEGPSPSGKAATSEQVHIPDAGLRKRIAKALDKDSDAPITVDDMATLDDLPAYTAGIRDLTGLELATNLVILNLSGNNIADVSPLAGLTDLLSLDLSGNNIADVSPLAGLSSLRHLELGGNYKIADISPLLGLTKLRSLDLSETYLNASSLNDHIPALQDRGVRVRHSHPPLRDKSSNFDIELVFLSSFTEEEEEIIRYAARRWESIIRGDLPDYTFTEDFDFKRKDWKRTIRISSGERIDDLRIYVINSEDSGDETWTTSTGFEMCNGPLGVADDVLWRETSYMPVVGAIMLCPKTNYTYGPEGFQASFTKTALHEIGHVLGIANANNLMWVSGFLRFDNERSASGITDLKNFQRSFEPKNLRFTGPLAVAAFDDAGGGDYTGHKVPIEVGGHWNQQVLYGELMAPYAGDNALSAITIQALADVGYEVDVIQADPFTLLSAEEIAKRRAESSEWFVDKWYGGSAGKPTLALPTWCGVGLRPQGPIYVGDEHGRVVRTINP